MRLLSWRFNVYRTLAVLSITCKRKILLCIPIISVILSKLSIPFRIVQKNTLIWLKGSDISVHLHGNNQVMSHSAFFSLHVQHPHWLDVIMVSMSQYVRQDFVRAQSASKEGGHLDSALDKNSGSYSGPKGQKKTTILHSGFCLCLVCVQSLSLPGLENSNQGNSGWVFLLTDKLMFSSWKDVFPVSFKQLVWTDSEVFFWGFFWCFLMGTTVPLFKSLEAFLHLMDVNRNYIDQKHWQL